MVSYKNNGTAATKNAVITDPLPKGVVCVSKSAVTPAADTEFSLDGGKNWVSPPLTRKVTAPDGKIEVKSIPDSEIAQVRWILKKDLLPGASGEIKFKVKVK